MQYLFDPIAFSLGPLTVHWYGIILTAAVLAGFYLAMQEGKRFNISQDFFMDLLLIGVPSAIIGARAYYVMFRWDDYKDNLWDVFKIWEGGIAIYGALIGALIFGIFYTRYKGYNFWRIVDICAPGLLIGQVVGRWGNFVNQEAYGGPVTESFLRNTLNLPKFIVDPMLIDGAYHHPTFLYESLWGLAGLVLLFILRRQPFVRAGEIFLSYFIWYSIGRFFIEGLRTDSLAIDAPEWLVSFMSAIWSPMKALGFEPGNMDYGNVRISQLVAVLIVIAAVITIYIRRTKGYADHKYSDPMVSTREVARNSAAYVSTEVPVKTEAVEELEAVEPRVGTEKFAPKEPEDK